ncbi:lysozyme inhibitor LprI family protein [Aidingimonas lacisalsi]|uniref:lysozyme inhibitor LprI family protein n=1 Tax=Aidingimonas lacisalsi TaxID=2604086 RepID=UPI0013761136|nr:lysozyme inhibitor LprI family protein [Aidingimonas lacisalsi]
MEYAKRTHCVSWMILAMLPASIGYAETESDPQDAISVTHPIEHRLDLCMEEGDWTTRSMRECTHAAYEEWQAEVEELKNRLSRALGSEAREALDASQRAWEKSRDAEFRFISAYHEEFRQAELGQGTLIPVAEQLRRNAVLRDRVQQLQRYLDGLEDIRE